MSIRSLSLALGAALLAATPVAAQDFGRFDRMFDRLDTNHDGAISRAEFQASRHARFLALDRDHDGFLTPADAPPRLAAFVAGRSGAFEAALRRFDTDHDGRVSEAEFVNASMTLFDEADANHDGVLTREEARGLAARLRAETEGRR